MMLRLSGFLVTLLCFSAAVSGIDLWEFNGDLAPYEAMGFPLLPSGPPLTFETDLLRGQTLGKLACVEAPDPQVGDISMGFTVAFWIRADFAPMTLGTNYVIVDKIPPPPGAPGGFQIGLSRDTPANMAITFGIRDGTNTYFMDKVSISDGTFGWVKSNYWNHIAISFSNSTVWDLYVNTIPYLNNTGLLGKTLVHSPGIPLRVGCSNNPTESPILGLLDNFILSPWLSSHADIIEMHNFGSFLLLELLFGGNGFWDNSGNDNHMSSSVPALDESMTGHAGIIQSYPGLYATGPSMPSFRSSFTLSFFLAPWGDKPFSDLFTTQDRAFVVSAAVAGDMSIMFKVSIMFDTMVDCATTSIQTKGNWMHFAIAWDMSPPGEMKLYRNGLLYETYPCNVPFSNWTYGNDGFTVFTPTTDLSIALDDLRLYSGARDADQIIDEYVTLNNFCTFELDQINSGRFNRGYPYSGCYLFVDVGNVTATLSDLQPVTSLFNIHPLVINSPLEEAIVKRMIDGWGNGVTPGTPTLSAPDTIGNGFCFDVTNQGSTVVGMQTLIFSVQSTIPEYETFWAGATAVGTTCDDSATAAFPASNLVSTMYVFSGMAGDTVYLPFTGTYGLVFPPHSTRCVCVKSTTSRSFINGMNQTPAGYNFATTGSLNAYSWWMMDSDWTMTMGAYPILRFDIYEVFPNYIGLNCVGTSGCGNVSTWPNETSVPLSWIGDAGANYRPGLTNISYFFDGEARTSSSMSLAMNSALMPGTCVAFASEFILNYDCNSSPTGSTMIMERDLATVSGVSVEITAHDAGLPLHGGDPFNLSFNLTLDGQIPFGPYGVIMVLMNGTALWDDKKWGESVSISNYPGINVYIDLGLGSDAYEHYLQTTIFGQDPTSRPRILLIRRAGYGPILRGPVTLSISISRLSLNPQFAGTVSPMFQFAAGFAIDGGYVQMSHRLSDPVQPVSPLEIIPDYCRIREFLYSNFDARAFVPGLRMYTEVQYPPRLDTWTFSLKTDETPDCVLEVSSTLSPTYKRFLPRALVNVTVPIGESYVNISTSNGSESTRIVYQLEFIRSRPVQIQVIAQNNVCVLVSKALTCFGTNAAGELGRGDTISVGGTYGWASTGISFVSFSAGTPPVKAIYGKTRGFCALFEGGKIKCFGLNSFGALGSDADSNIGVAAGDMTALQMIPFSDTHPIVQVSANKLVSCALFSSNILRCWGTNEVGELGIERTDIPMVGRNPLANGNMPMSLLPPVIMPPSTTVVSVAAAVNTVCALLAPSGRVRCWGSNSNKIVDDSSNLIYGQNPGEMMTLPEQDFGDGDEDSVVQIDAGSYFMCVRTRNSRVFCWGENTSGQCGLDIPDAVVPTWKAYNSGQGIQYKGRSISDPGPIDHMSVGSKHVCILFDRIMNGHAMCWGLNSMFQLGIADSSNRGTGLQRQTMGDTQYIDSWGQAIEALSCGGNTTCIHTRDGFVRCFGSMVTGPTRANDLEADVFGFDWWSRDPVHRPGDLLRVAPELATLTDNYGIVSSSNPGGFSPGIYVYENPAITGVMYSAPDLVVSATSVDPGSVVDIRVFDNPLLTDVLIRSPLRLFDYSSFRERFTTTGTGSATVTVPLNPGYNRVQVIVRNPDNRDHAEMYNVTLYAMSDRADIADMADSLGIIKMFNPAITSYSLDPQLSPDLKLKFLQVIAVDKGTTISVESLDGLSVYASGRGRVLAKHINFTANALNTIVVRATSETGTNIRVYTLSARHNASYTCSATSQLSPSRTLLSVAATNGSSCALVNGGLICYGRNDIGQCGLPTATYSTTTGDVTQLTPLDFNVTDAVSRVFSSSYDSGTTCVLFATGKVKCWGDTTGYDDVYRNYYLTDGVSALPFLQFDPLYVVKTVAIGISQVCVVFTNGIVRCAGVCTATNWLFSSCFDPFYEAAKSPPLPFVAPVSELSLGETYQCAVTTNGCVYCWGIDASQNNGMGDPDWKSNFALEQATCLRFAPALGNPLSVRVVGDATRGQSTLVMFDSGKVVGFGNNANGMLGLETSIACAPCRATAHSTGYYAVSDLPPMPFDGPVVSIERRKNGALLVFDNGGIRMIGETFLLNEFATSYNDIGLKTGREPNSVRGLGYLPLPASVIPKAISLHNSQIVISTADGATRMYGSDYQEDYKLGHLPIPELGFTSYNGFSLNISFINFDMGVPVLDPRGFNADIDQLSDSGGIVGGWFCPTRYSYSGGNVSLLQSGSNSTVSLLRVNASNLATTTRSCVLDITVTPCVVPPCLISRNNTLLDEVLSVRTSAQSTVNVTSRCVIPGGAQMQSSYQLSFYSLSSNSSLCQLSDALGVVTSFSPGLLNYGPKTVANAVTQLSWLAITPCEPTSSISINGVNQGTGFRNSTNLAIAASGPTTLTIVVFSEGSVTKTTYVLTMQKFSTDATLSSLVDALGATAGFLPNVTSYPIAPPAVLTVPHANSTLGFVTATCAGVGCSVCIGAGCTAHAGTWTESPIALAVGANVINVVSTAQDGVTKITYAVNVRRMSNDTGLAMLSDSLGVVANFSAAIKSYVGSAVVPMNVSEIVITVTCVDVAGCTRTINGATVIPVGTPSQTVPLVGGLNVITVTIQAEDSGAAAANVYTISVTRQSPPSTNALLQSLKLTMDTVPPSLISLIPAAFNATLLAYQANVAASQSAATGTLTAVCQDTQCSLSSSSCAAVGASTGKITCPLVNLVSGVNTVVVQVTAENSSVPIVEYTLTVTLPGTPKVTAISPTTGAPGDKVVITGSNFGSSAADIAQITVAGAPCALNAWFNSTMLSCTTDISASPTATGPATVKLTGQALPSVSGGSFAFVSGGNGGPVGPAPEFNPGFSAPAPVVTAVVPASGPTSGGTRVTIYGRQFGVRAGDLTAVSVGLACTSTSTWETASQVTCTTAANSPVGLQTVVVRTGTGGPSSAANGVKFRFIYPAPVILTANPRAVSPTGGTAVTLRGKFFGQGAASSVLVKVDGKPCLKTTWVSETQVVCNTPPGALTPPTTRLLMTIDVDGLESDPTDVGYVFGFRYGLECNPQCDWNQECSLLADCNNCRPGYVGAGCNTPLYEVRLSPMLVTSEDGMTSTGVIQLNANAGSGVTFALTSSDPLEGAVTPSTISFGSSDAVGSSKTFTLSGVPDDKRDGAREWMLSVKLAAGSNPDFAAVPAVPDVAALNMDSRPQISSLLPRAVPMVGFNVTLSGRHWDYEVAVNTTEGRATNITRLTFAESGRHRVARLEAQQATAEEDSLTAMFPPSTTKGYVDFTIVNIGGTSTTVSETLFYTDDCPYEGQWGRGRDCKDCPEGGECPGGYRIWPKPGYWNDGEDSGFVSRCTPKESCLGTRSNLCAPGYAGTVCGQCDKGFYRANNACQPCPKAKSILVYIIADCILWTLFGLAGVLIKDRMTFSYCVMAVRSLQMLSGLGEATDKGLPKWVMVIYSILHLFSGDYSFVKPDCFGHTPYLMSFVTSLAYNVMVFVPLWVMLLIALMFSKPERSSYWKDRFVRSLVIWLVFAYQPITAKLCETVSCYKSGGRHYMITLPSQVCYKPADHLALTIVSSLLMAVYTIGFPVMFLVFLRKPSNRELLHKDERFMERYNFLYEFYNPNHPYAWTAEFPIACVVAAGKSYLRPNINYQMAVSIIVFGLKLIYIIVFRPFIDWLTDLIQAVLAVASLIAINMNFLQRHGVFERVVALQTSISIAFVIMVAVSVVLSIVIIIYSLMRDPKARGEAEASDATNVQVEVPVLEDPESLVVLDSEHAAKLDQATQPNSQDDFLAPLWGLWDSLMGMISGDPSADVAPEPILIPEPTMDGGVPPPALDQNPPPAAEGPPPIQDPAQ